MKHCNSETTGGWLTARSTGGFTVLMTSHTADSVVRKQGEAIQHTHTHTDCRSNVGTYHDAVPCVLCCFALLFV